MFRLVASGASLLVALVPAGGAPARGAAWADEPALALRSTTSFDDLYNAGDSVDGLPLVAVLERDDTAKYVSFVYGDCAPADDSGCTPPAEIQVWPACRRSLALYGRSRATEPAVERTTIRGVPAASLDDGTRLELQTGRSTVVVFADSRARARRVADELRSLSGSVPQEAALPQPVPGALEGMVKC